MYEQTLIKTVKPIKENILKRAINAVKSWVSKFLNKVWNKINQQNNNYNYY